MSNLLKSKFVLGFVAVAIVFAGVSFANAADCSLGTTTLKFKQRSAAVTCLQTYLNVTPATGYFGPLTKAAVEAFQTNKGLTADGLVGKGTKAALVAGGTTTPTGDLCPNGMTLASNCTVLPTTTPTGELCPNGMTLASNCSVLPGGVVNPTGPVAVALGVTTPVSAYVLAGQAGADLAHFAFTGTGTVNSVTLQRTGVSDSNTLTNVYLYDGVTRLTSGYSFNTNGTITMNNLGIVVTGSKVISVKADVYGSTTSSTVGVALTSFTAGTAATLSTVRGNDMYIGTSTLAGVNFTSATVTPAANPNLNAGSTNQNLWSRSMTVSQHAVKLHNMTVKMIGSAPANTLANVALYVDGVNVAASTINTNNQFVFTLATPLSLSTGTHLVEVRGDVVGGAYRNFYMSLEQGTDLAIEDSQMAGVYVSTTSVGAVATNIVGGLVTIANGTLTVNQNVAFNNTTTLVGGSTSSTLASFKFTSYGEDVKVTSLSFMPTFTNLSGTSTTLTNVGLYVNGAPVGSNQTATTAVAIPFSNLGSQLLVTAGTPVVVELKGDLVNANTGGVNVGANVTSGTVKFDLSAGSSNAQGMSSSQLTSTSSSGGQTLTVASSNVTFAKTTGFAASIKAPNQAGVKIGSFTAQTASAEGITVNSIVVDLAGTLITNNQLTNLTIKDESTSTVIGTPVGNPVATGNNFSVSVPVPVSSTKVFGVYADLGSNAATYAVIPSMTIVYRGTTSNISTTSPTRAGIQTTANVATIAAGGTIFVPGSSPVSQLVIGGSTIANVATFNIRTSNNVGGAVIKDMTFTVPADTISAVTVNGKTAQVTGTTAVVYDAGLVIPSDNSGLNFPVSADLICAASSDCSGVANSSVTLTLTSYTFNDGSTIQTSTPTLAVSATHKLVTTKPTLTVTSSNTNGFGNGTYKVGEVTIAADAAGDLKIEQLPITLTVSGAGAITAGSVDLRDSTGTSTIAGVTPINGSGNFVFTTARTIAKGTSETFTVYAAYTGVTGPAGTQSTTFSLGAKASFLWTDVAGNVASITGAYVNGYSTNSQTKTN